jgi:hypothetical protein
MRFGGVVLRHRVEGHGCLGSLDVESKVGSVSDLLTHACTSACAPANTLFV